MIITTSFVASSSLLLYERLQIIFLGTQKCVRALFSWIPLFLFCFLFLFDAQNVREEKINFVFRLILLWFSMFFVVYSIRLICYFLNFFFTEWILFSSHFLNSLTEIDHLFSLKSKCSKEHSIEKKKIATFIHFA